METFLGQGGGSDLCSAAVDGSSGPSPNGSPRPLLLSEVDTPLPLCASLLIRSSLPRSLHSDVINRREAARESSETLLAEVDASVARLEALRAHATERSRLRETATGEASSYHGTTLSTAKAKLLVRRGAM